MIRRILLIAGLAVLAQDAGAQYRPLATAPAGTVPGGVHYQGRLEDNGFPAHGVKSMTFRVYDALAGGNLVWNSGAQAVTVTQGIFGIDLNIPVSVFTSTNSAAKFLEVQIENTLLVPREAIGTVPYAQVAKSVEGTLDISNGGLSISSVPTATNPAFFVSSGTGFVGLGNNSPASMLHLSSGALTIDGNSAVALTAVGRVGVGTGSPSAKLHLSSGTLAIDGNVATSLTATGSVGIGTNAPAAALDVNGAAQFGAGATRSTFTAAGDLALVSGATVAFNGTLSLSTATLALTGSPALFIDQAGRVTMISTATATHFVGDGSNLTNVSGSSLLIGTVDTTKLATDAVSTAKILNGAVETAKLAVDAVDSTKILGGAVQTAKLAVDAVTTAAILGGAVQTAKLATDAVTSGVILNGAVQTSKVATDAIVSGAILNGAVQTTKLATDAVTSGAILDGAVQTTKLATDAVTSGALLNGAVQTTKLATDAVTSGAILNGAVQTTKLASDAVTSAAILGSAVETSKLAVDAVSNSKLLTDSASLAKVSGGALFNSGGNIGLGTSTPQAKLDISGTLTTQGVTPAGTFQWTTAGNERTFLFTGQSGAGGWGTVGLASNDTEATGQALGLLVFAQKVSGKSSPSAPGLKASIIGYAEGAGGGVGGFGGAIVFNTKGDNSNSLWDERMRITSAGNLGIGSAGPITKVQVSSGALLLDGNGAKLETAGASAPSAACQGAGAPAVTGTDIAGLLNVGATPGTDCTITFQTPYVNAPICTANNVTTVNAIRPVTTTSTLQFIGTLAASDQISYICVGRR